MHRKSSTPRASLLAMAALGALAGACVRPDGAVEVLPGKELFAACVSCHGKDGLGNQKIAAPPIAGLPAWYVEAQLHKFRTDIRGAHPDDAEGLRMRPMSRQLMNEGEVSAVSAYVGSLPRGTLTPTMTGGDAAAGAAAYAVCSACHGARGEGNLALKAPPIAGQADWYLASQLRKFKVGIRGANPKDLSGATMRPMALTLTTEQAVQNVVAHVATLAK